MVDEDTKIKELPVNYPYLTYNKRRQKELIQITQNEYFILKDKVKDIHVKICSQRKRGAKSKTYWCEETKAAMTELSVIRKVVERC